MSATPTWYAIYNTADGTLVSVGTNVADATILQNKGLAAVQLANPPDFLNNVWDPTQRAMTAVQQIDRVADFITAHPAFWNALSAAQQSALQTALQNLLGSMRYRRQNEPANLP